MKTIPLFTYSVILGILFGQNFIGEKYSIAATTNVRKTLPVEVINLDENKHLAQPVFSAQAAQADSLSSSELVTKGIALTLAGKFEEAVELFRRAIELDPNRADAYDNLGNALAKMGKNEEAIEAYRRSIELYPDEAIAASPYDNLGLVLESMGQREKATEAYCYAISLAPNFRAPQFNLANAMSAQGIEKYQYLGVQQHDIPTFCQQYHDIDLSADRQSLPTICYLPPQVWASAGMVRSEIVINCLGLYGHLLFIQAFEEVDNAEELGDYPRAEDAYRKLVQMAPNFSHGWYLLGLNLDAQGKMDEAILAWKESIRLNPKINHAYYLLGVAMEQQGKIEEAVSYFRQALQIVPQDEEYRNALQEAERKLERQIQQRQ